MCGVLTVMLKFRTGRLSFLNWFLFSSRGHRHKVSDVSPPPPLLHLFFPSSLGGLGSVAKRLVGGGGTSAEPGSWSIDGPRLVLFPEDQALESRPEAPGQACGFCCR